MNRRHFTKILFAACMGPPGLKFWWEEDKQEDSIDIDRLLNEKRKPSYHARRAFDHLFTHSMRYCTKAQFDRHLDDLELTYYDYTPLKSKPATIKLDCWHLFVPEIALGYAYYLPASITPEDFANFKADVYEVMRQYQKEKPSDQFKHLLMEQLYNN